MEEPPKVAVITRTKDRPLFLQRAIESVLSQTFEDWVHVIVNDGGDPSAVDLLVKAYAGDYKDRVTVVHHSESKGMQNASNAGMDACDSLYAVIHDDDDSWYPDFLEKTVSHLEEQGSESLVQGVVVQTTQVFEEVCISGEIAQISTRAYYPFDFVSMEIMRKRNLFAPIAFLYRRAAYDKIGPFRQQFDVLGDHDFNLRFLRHFEIGVLPTFHAYYHWRHASHGNTVTRSRGVHRQMLNRLKNAYHRDLLDHPEKAVGDLAEIEFPKQDGTDPIPFRLRTEEPGPARPMPDFRNDFKFKVLSLDVFDTVLLRRCHHPKDVFKVLEERASSQLGLPLKPYALAREQAERLARREVHPEISPEVNLAEIYKVLARICGLKAAQRDKLMALEMEIEGQLLYADPRWAELYQTYREAGIRVIFVSDMYLERGAIQALMTRCGFADAEVYVSCDYSASKHDGTLQHLVADELGVAPNEILHVGDNFHSDFVKTLHAGWQAFHWSREFRYTPLYAQVDPYCHNDRDLLSRRVMGEVERLGLTRVESVTDPLVRLGQEVAGPLYLCYMRWVLARAREDGIRKLLLIGRDGYYWEKAIKILAEKETIGVDYAYLHSSRKVYNFASFHTLDANALKFLMTPNPALRVRDFIDRTGLKAEAFETFISIAGFPDLDEILTSEMGGSYLDDSIPPRLEKLFLLLKPDLEALFAEDRAGTLKVLEEADYSTKDCAFVDIGWNGSCVRPISRLLGLTPAQPVKAYFFGTWREALEGKSAVNYKSFFIHFSEPDDRFQLVRESVNLIEALHAAPYPTLLAFEHEGEKIKPVFSKELKSGFSEVQQEQLWHGAEAFLRAAIELPLPESTACSGLIYLQLAMTRFMREPSPREVRSWGPILHSDGFGLEVYKPLVEAVTDEVSGEQLMEAYRGSSWKRGFLAGITEDQRQFILERVERSPDKSYEKLHADLLWKTKQVDKLWGEKERWRWEAGHNRDLYEQLLLAHGKASGELDHIRQRLENTERQLNEARVEIGNCHARMEHLLAERNAFSNERDSLLQHRDALAADLEKDREEMASLRARLDEAEANLDWEKQQFADLWSRKDAAEDRCARLEAAFKDRGRILKSALTGKMPRI